MMRKIKTATTNIRKNNVYSNDFTRTSKRTDWRRWAKTTEVYL